MVTRKKIVVCCDGTGNDSDGTLNVPTNVAKIARCLEFHGQALDDPDSRIPQLVYYQSGVATKSAGTLGENFDGLTGRGITENVRAAYGFICNNYEPKDEIYLIGFSRGAYTVRIISTLINDVGLLTKHTLGYFYDIFTAWQVKNIVLKHQPQEVSQTPFEDVRRNVLDQPEFSRTEGVRINACAVFDTVGSLGIAVNDHGGVQNYLLDVLRGIGIHSLTETAKGTEAYEFVDTVVSPNIDHAFQALALDEHRGHFPPTIWEDPDHTTKTLKQCWFTGYHSNIGGGASDCGELANISLAWMLDQLSPYLHFQPGWINSTSTDDELKKTLQKYHIRGESTADGQYLRDSKRGFYKLDSTVPRTPGQYRTFRQDQKTGKRLDGSLKKTNETIHQSVRVRFWNNTRLLADGQKYRALGLAGHWKPGDNQPWPWSWLKLDEQIPDLPEEEYTANENAILHLWDNQQSQSNGLADFDLNDATH